MDRAQKHILTQLTLLIAFGGGTLLIGQSATTGALEGTIRDPQGAAVAGAMVTVSSPATGQQHQAESDDQGAYRFSMLAPAPYEVTFAAKGFKTARMERVTVSVSEVPVLDAGLEPGDAAETVACQCKVNSSAPSTGTLVDQKTITAVPLNTRNFTQVLSMSSGSAADVNNAGTLGRGTSSVNVNGNTTAGAYTMDGAYRLAPCPIPTRFPSSRSRHRNTTPASAPWCRTPTW